MSKTALQQLQESTSTPTNPQESKPQSGPTPSSKSEKFKILDAVATLLNKQFDTTASLVRLGSRVGAIMPHLATNIPSLDYGVLGIGGLPKGRIIEIFGPESAGKTTVTLEIISSEQQRGELCAFVDAEHSLDPNYAKSIGVNVEDLFVSQPDSGEQALETVLALVESKAVSLIVVDSVAALVPQAELDGDMGDSHMGLQARLMSQAMRKLRGVCAINGVTVIFINQIREKIGVMFGSPETTTGGRALKFYSSVRLDVRRVGGEAGKVMSGGVAVGHKMKLKAVKNKVGTPFKETTVDLIYGSGIDRFSDLIGYAAEVGALTKGGGGYISFKGEKIAQGLANAVNVLYDNPELVKKIRAELDAAIQAQRDVDHL